MSQLLKLDRGYDELFASIGVALVICTLLVSIGKALTYYYFIYITVIFLLILIGFGIYHYHNYQIKLLKLKEDLAAENPIVVGARKKTKDNKLEVPPIRLSIDVPPMQRKLNLRRTTDFSSNNGSSKRGDTLLTLPETLQRNGSSCSLLSLRRKSHYNEDAPSQLTKHEIKAITLTKPDESESVKVTELRASSTSSKTKEKRKFMKRRVLFGTSLLKRGFKCGYNSNKGKEDDSLSE